MTSFYIKRLAELGQFADIITIYDRARGAVDYLLLHKKSQQHLPDLILLDIYMPELDGWGFLMEFEKVKDQFIKRIKICIISSSSHPRDIERAKLFPEVSEYIQKPVTMDSLKKVLGRLDFSKADE